MGNVKRIRSVNKLFQMIKDSDPETEVSEYLVRKLVYEGYIPSVQSGSKKLASFEDLSAYLFEGKRWT